MTWPTVAIGEIAQQVRGVSYDKSQVSNSAAPGLRPVLRAGNIQEGNLLLNKDLVYVPDSCIAHQQLLRPGDIVIAASSGSIDVVGKAAQLSEPWEGSFGAFCKVVRPSSDRVNPRYLHHFFQSTGYRRKVSSLAAGANINNLKNEHIDELLLPLPPLEEQRRIAAILDKANDIQGRQQEASNVIQAVPRSFFLSLFGDPRVNSRSWHEHSLGELGRIVTGSTPPSSEQGMFDGPVPFITPGDLGSGKEPKRSLTESGSLRSRTVKRGSALVCCIGATIGKMDIARQDSAFNQQINAVEWGDSIIGGYGIEALRFFSRNIATAGASTTLPILKKSSFEKLRLPVPPVELQREYVLQLKAMHAHSESLHQALQISTSLKQSLVCRAFTGEL